MNKMSLKSTALGGITQNPIFVLVLGLCPVLATSTSLLGSVIMGLCTMFALLCSNITVSLLRKVIPDGVKLPAYIMIIATFVSVLQLFLDRYLHDFYQSYGTFIALIVVNCVIMSRAEQFAGTNNVFMSIVDGLSVGLGFVGAIALLGGLRQLLGEVLSIGVFLQPAGGFIALGVLLALFNFLVYFVKKQKGKNRKGKVTHKAPVEVE